MAVGLFGITQEISIDLRAERDTLIADENAHGCPSVTAPSFNEAPYFLLRLTAERATDRCVGVGHLGGLPRWLRLT
jgi:hypothetical protein